MSILYIHGIHPITKFIMKKSQIFLMDISLNVFTEVKHIYKVITNTKIAVFY